MGARVISNPIKNISNLVVENVIMRARSIKSANEVNFFLS